MDILNNNNLNWHTYTDLSDPRYPIDYADAVLSVSEDGRLEIVVKWQPNSFCHFHHHTADASSVILQGELIVIDVDPIRGGELGQATELSAIFVIKVREMYTENRLGQRAPWCFLLFLRPREK